MRNRGRGVAAALAVLSGVTLLFAVLSRAASGQDWRTASHEPAGLAPDPAKTPEAVVQVYGARTWGWRGTFGVHTWVAVKPVKAEGSAPIAAAGGKDKSEVKSDTSAPRPTATVAQAHNGKRPNA